jgi:hypothetical protein
MTTLSIRITDTNGSPLHDLMDIYKGLWSTGEYTEEELLSELQAEE